MPRTSPYNIRLSSAELAQLEKRAGKYTLPYFQVQRAKMILLAAEGLSNEQIAARLDTAVKSSVFGANGFLPSALLV
jgi:DNA-binding NarL/FixJ family response regulator